MRRKLRAVRGAGPEVASCDAHLADNMRDVTSPVNGEDNDTHVVVRRLVYAGPRCAKCINPASWVLIPQAVLR